MRLSDVRSCDYCRGPLFAPATGRAFYVVRFDLARVTQRGMAVVEAAMSGGVPLALAEAAEVGDTPAPQPPTVEIDETRSAPTEELVLCVRCRDHLLTMRERRPAPQGLPA